MTHLLLKFVYICKYFITHLLLKFVYICKYFITHLQLKFVYICKYFITHLLLKWHPAARTALWSTLSNIDVCEFLSIFANIWLHIWDKWLHICLAEATWLHGSPVGTSEAAEAAATGPHQVPTHPPPPWSYQRWKNVKKREKHLIQMIPENLGNSRKQGCDRSYIPSPEMGKLMPSFPLLCKNFWS